MILFLLCWFVLFTFHFHFQFHKWEYFLIKQSSLTIVIHSFDGYSRYWKGWIHYWKKYWPDCPYDIVFLVGPNYTEDVKELKAWSKVKVFHSYHMSWSDRLGDVLHSIKTPYVLYSQEDMWLTGKVENHLMEENLSFMGQKVHLQLSDDCVPCQRDLLWNDPRTYCFSHQLSIWNRDYLIDSLKGTDTPFQHEIKVNVDFRTNFNITLIGCAKHRIPFKDISRQGKLTPLGIQMVGNIKHYNKEFKRKDQIHTRQNH